MRKRTTKRHLRTHTCLLDTKIPKPARKSFVLLALRFALICFLFSARFFGLLRCWFFVAARLRAKYCAIFGRSFVFARLAPANELCNGDLFEKEHFFSVQIGLRRA